MPKKQSTQAEKDGRIPIKDVALRAAVVEITKLDPTCPTMTAAIRSAVFGKLDQLQAKQN